MFSKKNNNQFTLATPQLQMEDKISFLQYHPKRDYDIKQELGKGNYSVVHLGINKKNGEKSAIKIIKKKNAGQKGIEMVVTEVKILKALKHPNIVRLKEAYETKNHFYLVMELISGGELFDKIVELQSYSEKDASTIVRQMIEAVQHLHDKKVVHRDLKPENLLLESESPTSPIRLADFGLSKFIDPKQPLNVPVGTPGYVAPEVVECLDNPKKSYGKEVDLWAIGVITYILLCGYPPFYSEDDDEVFDQILEGDYEFLSPHWDNISDSAKDLIQKLLVLEPGKRLTAEEALKHPWVLGGAAPDAPLTGTISELKKFNARRKWKGAIIGVIATNRLTSRLKVLQNNSQKYEPVDDGTAGGPPKTGLSAMMAKLKLAEEAEAKEKAKESESKED